MINKKLELDKKFILFCNNYIYKFHFLYNIYS